MPTNENFLPNSLRLYLKNLGLKLLGLFFMALSIYLLLSILSYNSATQSLNTSSTFPQTNLCGNIGNTIANIFLCFFGIASLTFVFDTFIVGKYFFNPKNIHHPIQKILLYMIVSIIPTTLSLSYISSIMLSFFPTTAGLGGFLGLSTKSYIAELFTTLGITKYMHFIIFIRKTKGNYSIRR